MFVVSEETILVDRLLVEKCRLTGGRSLADTLSLRPPVVALLLGLWRHVGPVEGEGGERGLVGAALVALFARVRGLFLLEPGLDW